MSNYFRATNLEERIRLPLAKPKLKQVFHCHLMALATVVPQGNIASLSDQGQARGYGRITHKRGRTTGGHYFQDLFTAKPLDIHHFLGYQMKDLDIVFPKIPHNTL